MPKVNCAVIGCVNSSYKIKKWKNEICEEHGLRKIRSECDNCERPFLLYCFPSKLKNLEKRKTWINLIRREGQGKAKWEPKESDRVCSVHFVDGFPTLENPNPSLHLGYESKINKLRRKLIRQPLASSNSPLINTTSSSLQLDSASNPDDHAHGADEGDAAVSSPAAVATVDVNLQSSSNIKHCNDNAEFFASDGTLSPPTKKFMGNANQNSNTSLELHDHSSYCLPEEAKDSCCLSCNRKDKMIEDHVKKVKSLSINIRNKNCEKVVHYMSWRKIKTNAKMNFYTGLSSVALFQALFLILRPYLDNICYWSGPARFSSKIANYRKKVTKGKRKLCQRDEFLLTLMRLRLGLLNEDEADRFGISVSVSSRIFSTWIKILSQLIGKSLVVWLPQDAIKENLPQMFHRAGYSNCRVILDCTEVFIERPKTLDNQSYTWSDYKHHNTVKFLVGISPSGYITFLSDCYGGRASDKFITNDSGFYNLLERGDQVMADRAFQIREELLFHFCDLVLPPGARLKSQMTSTEVKKTKHVANLRIHVERAINRIKTFRILKSTLPITMLQHIDDIVLSCAGLCNLKPKLIQKK